MSVYAAIAVRSFRRYSTYRIATASGAFTNTVWGFILCGIYLTLWHLSPSLGGYDASAAVTFVWLQQGLLQPLGMFGGGTTTELGERVRSGAIAVDLYRPVNLLAFWLSADLGRAGFQLLIRGGVPLLIGSLAFDLRFPSSPGQLLAFAVAVLLGLLISFGIGYLVALSAFWIADSRGTEMALMVVTLFFSGMILPLVAFPDGLRDVARATPWAGMLQVPVDVWLGRQPGGVLGAFAFQGTWVVVLLLAGMLTTSLATRKVVVAGG